MHDILIIAHRGQGATSGLTGSSGINRDDIVPENTMKAFRSVVQVADGIEFDVRQCRDNYVVIHSNALNKHVERANRGGSDLGTVFDMTLEELQKFDVGEGERIPSLEEIFHFLSPRIETGKNTTESRSS